MVGTPEVPVVLGSVADATNLNGPFAVAYANGYAYVAANDAGRLTVVDVSNPSSPLVVGSVYSSNLAALSKVVYSNGYCYATSSTNDRLVVLDVSDPTAPTIVGTLTDATNLDRPGGLAYNDGYCYVATYSDRLTVVDVSNPANPVMRGWVYSGNSNSLRHVTYGDGYVYVAAQYTNRLLVVDVSTPTAPTIVGTLTDATNLASAYGLAYNDGYCYVATYSDRLTVVDVSNPANPVVTGSVLNSTVLNQATSVAYENGFCYVTTFQNPGVMSAVDVSNPASPFVAGSISDTRLYNSYGIAYQDGYAYVVSYDGDRLTVVEAFANQPPDAPTLVDPADGATLDRQQNNVLRWQFNDPDTGDSQSAYNVAWRPQGTTTWTETGWVTSTATQRTVAGSTFQAADYEWRVRTKDAQGEPSPWSSVGFFTATDAPPGPSMVDPPNGGTIPTDEYPVTWSTPDQDAYQLQVLDGETVLFDTGQVNTSGQRTRVVTFPDNNVTRTIRVRVLFGGLWSPWSSATVTVSYTQPAQPLVTATPVDVGAGVLSAIRVDVNDPAPVGDQPSVVAHDVWVRGGPEGEIRLAVDLPASLPYVWHLPASGVGYEFRARAVGENGTSSWSEWVA